MNFLTLSLLCLAAGILDRVRGGFPSDDHFKPSQLTLKNGVRTGLMFLYGPIVCAPFGLTWWQMVMVGVTWKFGEQIAGNFGRMFQVFMHPQTPGEPWQLAVLRVGGLWPLLTVAGLWYWHHNSWILIPAMIVANFTAAKTSNAIGDTPWVPAWFLGLNVKGGWMEFLRGAIVSALFAIGVAWS